MPTTKSPSLFAVEGVFKGLEKINEYVSLNRDTTDSNIESESAYWWEMSMIKSSIKLYLKAKLIK